MADDQFRIKTITILEKYEADIEPFRGREEEFFRLHEPFERKVAEGNVGLKEGKNAIWTLVCGGTATAYNNANARIGVGDSNAAEADTQTGLQGANTAFRAMDTGYPTFGTNEQAVFAATFGMAEANFAWEEWTIDNGATANKNLNRKVQALGTKLNTETWRLTCTLSL